MTQNKPIQEPIQLGKMIFFQNLVPGKQQSQLIDDFKSECLDSEKDESIKQQRENLLMEFPPILSFKNEQEKDKFYDDECKKKNQQFCCGGMSPISASYINDVAFTPIDNYVFSSGNGQLYQGSQKIIGDTIKQDIGKTQFGSTSQGELMDGLKTFDKAVTERSQPSSIIEADSPAPELTESKTPNPFDMTLKPKDEK